MHRTDIQPVAIVLKTSVWYECDELLKSSNVFIVKDYVEDCEDDIGTLMRINAEAVQLSNVFKAVDLIVMLTDVVPCSESAISGTNYLFFWTTYFYVFTNAYKYFPCRSACNFPYGCFHYWQYPSSARTKIELFEKIGWNLPVILKKAKRRKEKSDAKKLLLWYQ